MVVGSTCTCIVCSHSVGRGLGAEVYVMVECSCFAYCGINNFRIVPRVLPGVCRQKLTVCLFAVDGMLIEMYGKSWIAGLLTSEDAMLYMAGFIAT